MVNKPTRRTDDLIGKDLWNIQLDDNGQLKHLLFKSNTRHRRKFCRC